MTDPSLPPSRPHYAHHQPSSSSSSMRTVRPSHAQFTNPHVIHESQDVLMPTLPSPQLDMDLLNHSLSSRHPVPRYFFPPVPPARTSSLVTLPLSPPSPNMPSFQVTQPTPTKTQKTGFRKSSEITSTEDGSPRPRGKGSGAGDGSGGSLKVDVEEEDEDKATHVLDDKAMRKREMGRHRQRKKREKDKAAKENAITASRLHIPQDNPNIYAQSIPSSTASSYTSLPYTGSMYSLSPGFNASFASTSLSGQSSPGTGLFSPAVSTTSDNPFVWSNSGTTSTSSLNIAPPQNHIQGKPRSVSNATPYTQTHLQHPPRQQGLPSPSKRRKSEPQPEDFRSTLPTQPIGLGLTAAMELTSLEEDTILRIPQTATPDGSSFMGMGLAMGRPKPRRTNSAPDPESLVEKMEEDRSPTPPPVSSHTVLPKIDTLPTPSLRSTQGRAGLGDAEHFAQLLVQAVNQPVNTPLIRTMQDRLGVRMDSLYGFALEWYAKCGVLEGLEGHFGQDETSAESSVIMSTSNSLSDPTSPSSPIRQDIPLHTSFFTPATSRGVNRHPQTQPSRAAQMSLHQPLAPPYQPVPRPRAAMYIPTQPVQSGGSRPTSSNTTSPRKRILEPDNQFPTHQSAWTNHPIVTQSTPAPIVIPTQSQMSDTQSPNSDVQTPSTGQGGFQIDQMAMGQAGHWRSTTDPGLGRYYHTERESLGGMGDGRSGMLDSPVVIKGYGSGEGNPGMFPRTDIKQDYRHPPQHRSSQSMSYPQNQFLPDIPPGHHPQAGVPQMLPNHMMTPITVYNPDQRPIYSLPPPFPRDITIGHPLQPMYVLPMQTPIRPQGVVWGHQAGLPDTPLSAREMGGMGVEELVYQGRVECERLGSRGGK